MDDQNEATISIVNDLPNNAYLFNNGSGLYTLRWLIDLPTADLPNFNRTLSIVATDNLNATTLLTPQIQICACDPQGGNCTLEGLIDVMSNPLTLNCECGLGELLHRSR